jgi:serine phosphatase RsbU (regulator of sigma subunit)
MFTRRRLLDNLRRARPGQQPGGILATLMDEVSRHIGDGPAQDDMTALLISRECTGGS